MGGSSDSYSEHRSYTTNTTYEPDKVKKAEIEARSKIESAKIEGHNIHLRKQAAIEIIEHNARMQQLIIEAKTNGFIQAKEALLDFNKKINFISEERFRMLEFCTLDSVKTINKYYNEINTYIETESNEFMIIKIPEMMNTLNKLKSNIDTYELYKKGVDGMISLFIKSKADWIEQMRMQMNKHIESTFTTKENINLEIAQCVENRMLLLEKAVDQYESDKQLTTNIQNIIETNNSSKNKKQIRG